MYTIPDFMNIRAKPCEAHFLGVAQSSERKLGRGLSQSMSGLRKTGAEANVL